MSLAVTTNAVTRHVFAPATQRSSKKRPPGAMVEFSKLAVQLSLEPRLRQMLVGTSILSALLAVSWILKPKQQKRWRHLALALDALAVSP